MARYSGYSMMTDAKATVRRYILNSVKVTKQMQDFHPGDRGLCPVLCKLLSVEFFLLYITLCYPATSSRC